MAPHQMMERKAFERRLFAEHRINLHEADLGHIVKTFGDEHGRVNWEAFAAALGHNNAVSKNARRDAGGFVWQELPSTLRTQRWEPAKLERKIADKLVQRMAGGATGYTHQRCYILLAGTRTEWEGDDERCWCSAAELKKRLQDKLAIVVGEDDLHALFARRGVSSSGRIDLKAFVASVLPSDYTAGNMTEKGDIARAAASVRFNKSTGAGGGVPKSPINHRAAAPKWTPSALEHKIREKVTQHVEPGSSFTFQSYYKLFAADNSETNSTISAAQLRAKLESRFSIYASEHDVAVLFNNLSGGKAENGKMGVKELVRQLLPQDYSRPQPWDHAPSFESSHNSTVVPKHHEDLTHVDLPKSLTSRRWSVEKLEKKIREKIASKISISGSTCQYQQCFKLFSDGKNTNNSGISKEQLKRKLGNWGIIVNTEQCDALFRKYDEDDSGVIDRLEFIQRVMPADFAGLQIWDQRETYESRKMGDRRGKEKDMRNEISMLPKSLAAYRWSLDMIEEQLRQKMNMRSNYVGNYKFQNAYSMFREHTKRHNKLHGQMTPEEFTHFLRLKFDLFLQPPEVAMLMTKYDDNRNGVIDTPEFVRMMIPPDHSGFQVGESTDSYGVRKSGAVSLRKEKDERQLRDGLGVPLGEIEQQLREKIMCKSKLEGNFMYQNAYRLFRSGRDSRGDGITLPQFREILRLKFDMLLSAPEAENLFAKYDADQSGHIDIQEFVRHLLPADFDGRHHLTPKTGGQIDMHTAINEEIYRATGKYRDVSNVAGVSMFESNAEDAAFALEQHQPAKPRVVVRAAAPFATEAAAASPLVVRPMSAASGGRPRTPAAAAASPLVVRPMSAASGGRPASPRPLSASAGRPWSATRSGGGGGGTVHDRAEALLAQVRRAATPDATAAARPGLYATASASAATAASAAQPGTRSGGGPVVVPALNLHGAVSPTPPSRPSTAGRGRPQSAGSQSARGPRPKSAASSRPSSARLSASSPRGLAAAVKAATERRDLERGFESTGGTEKQQSARRLAQQNRKPRRAGPRKSPRFRPFYSHGQDSGGGSTNNDGGLAVTGRKFTRPSSRPMPGSHSAARNEERTKVAWGSRSGSGSGAQQLQQTIVAASVSMSGSGHYVPAAVQSQQPLVALR